MAEIERIAQKEYAMVTAGHSIYIRTVMPCPSMSPKLFLTAQMIVVEYHLFLTGPICFGRVQIILDRSKLVIKLSPERPNLNVTNDLDLTKTIWTVQNQFRPIEGQGKSC